MSRQALPNSCNSQFAQHKKFRFTLPMISARLALLFIVALILTLFLASGHVTAERLFQSPQSPPEQPLPEQPAPEQPAPEQPTPEQPATEQPTTEQPTTEQPTTEQPTTEQPTTEQPTPPAEQPVTDQTGIEQSSPIQPANEAAPAPTLEPLAPVTTGDEAGQVNESEPRPSNEDTPMVLDEAELIDSVFVSIAYVWLCCGVLLLLLIPLGLLILYVRGRSKIVNEEGF